MNRGSLWRKWDLHVHTPCSARHNYGRQTDIWDKFVYELEKKARDYEVKGIGVTDYFSIEGYVKLQEYQKCGKLRDIFLLPNIEFRLDKFVGNRRLNFHVIFSDQLPIEKIEKDFLENLKIRSVRGDEISLRKENIIEIGKQLKSQQKDFQNMDDYSAGVMNITVSQDDIIEVLDRQKSIFKGKYLFVLSQEGWDDMDWCGQDHLTRKVLFRKSHALFSANPNTIKWATGKRDIDPEKFIEEFGSLKPCLWGSDAHDFDRLLLPDMNRFTWIKADLSFEGLKQIIYEPFDRIKIQHENPEHRKNIYTLSSVTFRNSHINEDLEIEEKEIYLNYNLVAVIGGKGAGKTAFLDLIANCFEDRCKRGNPSAEDKNSFVQRIEEDKPDLECEIGFLGQQIQKFKKNLIDENYFHEGAILYMPQGKIEEYSSDRIRLQQKIEEIIFNNEKIREAEFKNDFDKSREAIKAISDKITQINREIYDLSLQTSTQVTQPLLSEKQKIEGKLKNKIDEIEKFQFEIDADKSKKVENLRKEEHTLGIIHSKITQLLHNLSIVRDLIEQFENDINSRLDLINDELISLTKQDNVSYFQISRIDFTKHVEQIKKNEEYLSSQKADLDKKIKEKEKLIANFAEEERKHAALLKEKMDIESKLKEIEQKLSKINSLKEKIEELSKQRAEEYSKLIKTWLELKSFYMKIIDTFSEGKSEILEDINFSSQIFFDQEKFIKDGENILDMRTIRVTELEELAQRLNMVINSAHFSPENLSNFVSKEKELVKSLKPVKGNLLLFYEWFYGNYFSLNTEIFFKNISLKKLSIGQRGTVLLKLILAEGDSPIVIDQPEENLDNKFIYEALVKAFRESKKKRQIVIATHNANLVVNTDAEQIIVAEYKDNKITFNSGSIENPEIRNEITSILEGGEEAFKKREEKYGIAH